MKRLLILVASLFVCTMFVSPGTQAESIACAAAVPTPPKGSWYYRLIDGRKCWYEGKPMLPKSSLHWPKDKPVIEADAATPAPPPEIRPSTDGRGAGDIGTSQPPDPNIWPAPPPAGDDTSFESRWQALKPRD